MKKTVGMTLIKGDTRTVAIPREALEKIGVDLNQELTPLKISYDVEAQQIILSKVDEEITRQKFIDWFFNNDWQVRAEILAELSKNV